MLGARIEKARAARSARRAPRASGGRPSAARGAQPARRHQAPGRLLRPRQWRGRRRRRARGPGPGRALRRARRLDPARPAAAIEVDGQAVKFSPSRRRDSRRHRLCARRPHRGARHAAVGAREHRAAVQRRARATGDRSTCGKERSRGRQRHRAAADRHPRAARGAAALRRQPAEGDDRPLDRGRTRAPSCASTRRAASMSAPSRRSTGCCASSPARASPCCSTPPSSRRCSSSATAPSSSSAAAWSTSCRPRSPTRPALTRAAYGLPRDAKADVGILADARPTGGRAMIRLLRQNGWVVGLFVLLRAAVRRHQDDPAELRRRRLRLAGPRGAALTPSPSRRRPSSSSPAASTFRSPSMMALTSVTAASMMDGASEEFALFVVPFVLAMGLVLGARQRHPHRRHPRARHRRHARDAVRAAGRRAAGARRAGRRCRRMAEGPDRRHRADPRRARQRRPPGSRRRWCCCVVCLGVVWIPLKRSQLGLSIYAIGSSELAAFRSGVPVARTKIVAYALAGLFARDGRAVADHEHRHRRADPRPVSARQRRRGRARRRRARRRHAAGCSARSSPSSCCGWCAPT